MRQQAKSGEERTAGDTTGFRVAKNPADLGTGTSMRRLYLLCKKNAISLDRCTRITAGEGRVVSAACPRTSLPANHS